MLFNQPPERVDTPCSIIVSGTEIFLSNVDYPGLFFYNREELGDLEGSQVDVQYAFFMSGLRIPGELSEGHLLLLIKDIILDFDMDARLTSAARIEAIIREIGERHHEDVVLGIMNNGKAVFFWYDHADKSYSTRSTTSNSNPGNLIMIGEAARLSAFAGLVGGLSLMEDYANLIRLADGSCNTPVRSLTIVLNNRSGMEFNGPYQNTPIHPNLLRSKLHASIIFGGTFQVTQTGTF